MDEERVSEDEARHIMALREVDNNNYRAHRNQGLRLSTCEVLTTCSELVPGYKGRSVFRVESMIQTLRCFYVRNTGEKRLRKKL